jgi:hypothetical protein
MRKFNVLLLILIVLASQFIVFQFAPSVKANPSAEDFSDPAWVEVDVAQDRIQVVGTNHIDHLAYRNEDTYKYRDKGANHFGNFTHKVDFKSDFAQTGCRAHPWALAKKVNDIKGIYDSNDANSMVLCVQVYDDGTGKTINVVDFKANKAGATADLYTALSANTWYYLMIKKSGTSLKVGIYSTALLRDAGNAEDGDVDNLAITLAADYQLQYVYACNTWNSGSNVYQSFDVENLDLEEAGGYALNLRVMDWDLTDAISGATVYKDTDTKTSNGGGWANWTGVSGTVAVKVKYYGFWVNGTFNVIMTSDKTINVQCKLYDVTVTAKTNNEIGVISGANVTAYNNTGTSNGKIKSGITVDTTGQVTLTNVPNATLRFIMYAKSDYSIIIANTTQLISSDDYSFNIVANQNYVTVTLSFGYEAIIWMNALSILHLLGIISIIVHKKLKKRNGGEKACMQEKHV